MKNLTDVQKNLEAFEKKFGLPILGAQQGSAAWFSAKLGVISASNAAKAVAKKDSETRLTYMSELVAQVCTGLIEELNNRYVEWGNSHEDAARSHYEFSTGLTMVQLPFVFKDDNFREGCSPDGIVSDSKGAEIKCPFNSVHFVKFFTEDSIKPEYQWQYQYTMRIMECDEWDFVQYDPRMKKNPLKILTVKRDVEKQKTFDDLIPQFILDMDKMLEKIGIPFGEQWKRLNNGVS
jgi:exodeoxyribonuclease (lambda-induced)